MTEIVVKIGTWFLDAYQAFIHYLVILFQPAKKGQAINLSSKLIF